MTPQVSYWNGRPLTDLTRKELIEVVEELGRMLSREREHHGEELRVLSGTHREVP